MLNAVFLLCLGKKDLYHLPDDLKGSPEIYRKDNKHLRKKPKLEVLL